VVSILHLWQSGYGLELTIGKSWFRILSSTTWQSCCSPDSCFVALWDYECFQKFETWLSVHTFSTHHSSKLCMFQTRTHNLCPPKWTLLPVSQATHHSSSLRVQDDSLLIKSSVGSFYYSANKLDRSNRIVKTIELVLKRRIIVVIMQDSRCFLLHRLEQHRRFLLWKETYTVLAKTCGSLRTSFSRPDMQNTQPHLNNLTDWVVRIQLISWDPRDCPRPLPT